MEGKQQSVVIFPGRIDFAPLNCSELLTRSGGGPRGPAMWGTGEEIKIEIRILIGCALASEA